MKSLISINNKFMDISPKRLVDLILKSKHTAGVEIYVDYNNETHVKYLEDLTYEIKRNNLILQIHGSINLELEKQVKYIKMLERYSDYLGYPIVVTLHSLYDDDKSFSREKTAEYISSLLKQIDSDKIIISLENLNDVENMDRLEKEYIEPIILNDEKLFFTYDIGHEIMDHGNVTNLSKYLIEDIRNVHLHTNNGMDDHKPIYKGDKNWNEIIKALIYLVNNNYKYNVVYEYDLYACYGNDVEDKIVDYLNSIDYVSERYDYEDVND